MFVSKTSQFQNKRQHKFSQHIFYCESHMINLNNYILLYGRHANSLAILFFTLMEFIVDVWKYSRIITFTYNHDNIFVEGWSHNAFTHLTPTFEDNHLAVKKVSYHDIYY